MKLTPFKNLTQFRAVHHPGGVRKTWKLSLLTAFSVMPCLSVQGAIITPLSVQYVSNLETYDINAQIPEGHILADWKIWKFPGEANGTPYSAVTGASPEMASGSGQIGRALPDSGQNYALGAGGITGLNFTWTGGAAPYANGPGSGGIPVATAWAGENVPLLIVSNLQPGVTYELKFLAAGFFRDPVATLESGASSGFDTDEDFLDTIYSTQSSIVTVRFDTTVAGDSLTLLGGMGDYGGGVLGARLTATAVGFISVTGVSLDTDTLSVDVGETAQLAATVRPSGADNPSVFWSSDAADIASVDSSGLITAVKAGRALITVTTVDGSYSDNCLVTVLDDTLWRGKYIIEDEYFVETYDFMGMAYIRYDPWIWSYSAMKWYYVSEGNFYTEGSWLWSFN